MLWLVVLLVLVACVFWHRSQAPAAALITSTGPPPPADSHLQWHPIPPPEATADADRQLLSWLLANGVQFHPAVQIGYFANDCYLDPATGSPLAVRGICTTEAVPAGSTLVTVPGHLVMDESALQQSVLAPLIDSLQPPPLVQAALQLMLARAEGPTGLCSELVAGLPVTPPGLPFWDDRPEWLQGTRVVQLAERLKAHREGLWLQHVKPLAEQCSRVMPPEHATLEDFSWACGILKCVRK